MLDSWPIRRLITGALVLSFVSVLPLVGIVFYRLHQSKSAAPVWAQLAEASRWLALSSVCGGAASSSMAKADLERWRDALDRLSRHRVWMQGSGLAGQLRALGMEVDRALAADSSTWVPWVAARCQQAQGVAAQALERAVQLGLDPTSRADRYEDLALRDVTTYLAVWVLFCVVLAVTVGRVVVRPARRLERVLARIADGDLSTHIPVPDGPMAELAGTIRRAVERLEQRDGAKVGRIVELRNLVRRLVDLNEQPVLVLGMDRKLNYANRAAAAAFGEDVEALQGAALTHVPGGQAVISLMDDILGQGEPDRESVLATGGAADVKRLARCAVVRDDRGSPSRVIMVLQSAEGAWWRKLFKGLEN